MSINAKAGVLFKMQKRVSDVTITNSSLSSSWRIFVDSNAAESKKVSVTTNTVAEDGSVTTATEEVNASVDVASMSSLYLENSSLLIGYSNKATGADHLILRGITPTVIKDCRITTDGANSWAPAATHDTLKFEGTIYCDTDYFDKDNQTVDGQSVTNYKYIDDNSNGLTKYTLTGNNEFTYVFTKDGPPEAAVGDVSHFHDFEGLNFYTEYETDTDSRSYSPYFTKNATSGLKFNNPYARYEVRDGLSGNRYLTFSAGDLKKFPRDAWMAFGDDYMNFSDYEYYVIEFDMSTDSEFINGSSFYHNYRNSSGNKQTYNTITLTKMSDGSYAISTDGYGGKKYYPIDSTPGVWSHITYAVKVNKLNDENTIGSYDLNILIYLNGELIFNQDMASPEATLSNAFRFHTSTADTAVITPGATNCYDNLSFRAYKRTTANENLADLFSVRPDDLTDYKTVDEIRYNGDYRMPVSSYNAFVTGGGNDVYFADLDDAMAYANDGDLITVYNPIKEIVDVNKAVTVKLEATEIVARSATHYRTVNGNTWVYAKYTGAEDQGYTVNIYEQDGQTLIATVTLPKGSALLLKEFDDGKYYVPKGTDDLYSFLGWADSVNGTQYVDTVVHENGTYTYYRRGTEKAQNILYLASYDEGASYIYGDDYEELASEINGAMNNKTYKVKLYNDYTGIGNKIEMNKTGAVLYFDLGGHSLNFTNKFSMFVLGGKGTQLYLYSSAEGGSIISRDASNDQAGNVVTLSGTGSEAYIGSFDGNGYGDNLYINTSCIVDTIQDKPNITFYIDGGTYVRGIADYSGFFISRNSSLTGYIKNADFVFSLKRSQEMFNCADPSCHIYATVEDCNLISLHGDDKLYNGYNAESSFVYNRCKFFGMSNNNPNSVFGEGCLSDNAYAGMILWDEDVKLDYRCNDEGSTDVKGYSSVYKALYATVGADYVAPAISGNMANLSLYTNFVMNVYVPVGTTAVRITLTHGGDAVNLAECERTTIKGVEYYVFRTAFNANATTEDAKLYLVDASGYVKEFSLSVVDYAASLLAGATYEAEDKELMMAALRYISEAEKYLNGSVNAEIAAVLNNPDYKQYITDYTDYGTAFDTEALSVAIKNACLELDEQPDFIFTAKDGFAGTVTVTYYNFGGTEVTSVYNISAEDEVRTISVDTMKIHELYKNLVITAEGTVNGDSVSVKGRYNLGTYVQELKDGSEGQSLAKAIYAYSMAAADYRRTVVENNGF